MVHFVEMSKIFFFLEGIWLRVVLTAFRIFEGTKISAVVGALARAVQRFFRGSKLASAYLLHTSASFISQLSLKWFPSSTLTMAALWGPGVPPRREWTEFLNAQALCRKTMRNLCAYLRPRNVWCLCTGSERRANERVRSNNRTVEKKESGAIPFWKVRDHSESS